MDFFCHNFPFNERNSPHIDILIQLTVRLVKSIATDEYGRSAQSSSNKSMMLCPLLKLLKHNRHELSKFSIIRNVLSCRSFCGDVFFSNFVFDMVFVILNKCFVFFSTPIYGLFISLRDVYEYEKRTKLKEVVNQLPVDMDRLLT